MSDLAVLAARPSAGKSALALAISRNFAIGQGGKVGMFSLEMAAEQVAQRLVAAEAGVESQRLAWGRHTDEEEGAISRAIGALSQAEVFIDDTPGLTVAELRAKARRLTADIGLDLIVVDHMQLIHSGFGYESNRVAEMSYISRALKELARELRVPVLALSQLSRAVEARQPHVPLLSDLRESGAIEQDADVVLFIYREGHVHEPGSVGGRIIRASRARTTQRGWPRSSSRSIATARRAPSISASSGTRPSSKTCSCTTTPRAPAPRPAPTRSGA